MEVNEPVSLVCQVNEIAHSKLRYTADDTFACFTMISYNFTSSTSNVQASWFHMSVTDNDFENVLTPQRLNAIIISSTCTVWQNKTQLFLTDRLSHAGHLASRITMTSSGRWDWDITSCGGTPGVISSWFATRLIN